MSFSQARLFLVALACLALLACGGGSGGSGVGYQSDSKPLASAEAIGSSTTTTGMVVVRSGSEVLLTGKESDGQDDPILEFQWRQIDESGVQVELIERAVNAKAFTAPYVDEPIVLQFELTVGDSEAEQDSDQVKIKILPIQDTGRFLQLKVDELSRYQYQLVVFGHSESISGGEFSLRIETIAQWPDRDNSTREMLLGSETVVGSWREGDNIDAELAWAIANPRIVRDIPSLDVDDINKHFEDDGKRDGRLELNKVGQARLYQRFYLDSFDNNAQVLLAYHNGNTQSLFDTVNGDMSSDRVSAEEMRNMAGLESRTTASDYYDLIDAPDTLQKWLSIAGFPADLEGSEDIAKARYVNNYDLGFGREMYLRVDKECGDVYSFVNNYPTLENAIQRRNGFATVAMEYSAIDRSCDGQKIVKFLAYVPNKTTGDVELALSMNFDSRGEKFMPGVCVACHRGTVADFLSGQSALQNAELNLSDRTALADLNSSFIPWDLDSLLFADGDPAMTEYRERISDEDRVTYSRNSQEGQLRALNEGALQTYLVDTERYGAAIKLVHGWYGSYGNNSPCQDGADNEDLTGTEFLPQDIAKLPGEKFNGEYTPCGWRGEETVYHGAVARNCRICHNQTHVLGKNFDFAEEFFSNEKLEAYAFDEGSMPLARVTYDRFWVDFYNGATAASMLANRLGVPASHRPGRPIAKIVIDAIELESGVVVEEPLIGNVIRLSGYNSRFSDSYSWQVSSDCGFKPELVGAQESVASFTSSDQPCGYTVTLTASRQGKSHRAVETVILR